MRIGSSRNKSIDNVIGSSFACDWQRHAETGSISALAWRPGGRDWCTWDDGFSNHRVLPTAHGLAERAKCRRNHWLVGDLSRGHCDWWIALMTSYRQQITWLVQYLLKKSRLCFQAIKNATNECFLCNLNVGQTVLTLSALSAVSYLSALSLLSAVYLSAL